MDRRQFFRGGIAGVLMGAAGMVKAQEPPDSPYDLLRDHRLHLMTGRNLYPAEVFVDGKPIGYATEIIARPTPSTPAYGAVRYCLLRNGHPYAQGNEAATDWVFGIVTWRRKQQIKIETGIMAEGGIIGKPFHSTLGSDLGEAILPRSMMETFRKNHAL